MNLFCPADVSVPLTMNLKGLIIVIETVQQGAGAVGAILPW